MFECECVCVKRRKMKDRPEIATFFLNTNIQYDLHAIKTLWIYIVVIVNINFTIYFYVFQAFLLLLLFLLKYLAPSTHWYAVHLHSLVLKTLNYEKSCDIWKPNGKFYFFMIFEIAYNLVCKSQFQLDLPSTVCFVLFFLILFN